MRMQIVSIVILCMSTVVAAQDAPLHRKVSVDFHDQEVGDVLRDLSGRAGVQFVCDPELIENADRVTLAAKETEVGRIVGYVLRPRGLRLGRLAGNGVPLEKLDVLAELKPQRAERFEFVEKPTASRDGDQMTIRFTVADFCDATVAIEDAGGKIMRHLASGVLGPRAPEPFTWSSKRQEIIWDCKDDAGQYVRGDDLVIRVSLGLKPKFERTLYWSPYKLGQNGEQPTFAVAPEGVYVFSAGVGRVSLTPCLKQFDHDGKYVRSLFPLPASQITRAVGVTWNSYPPDGNERKFALKGPPEAQTSIWPWPAAPGELLKLGDVRPMLVADNEYVCVLGPQSVRIAKADSDKASSLAGPAATLSISAGNRQVRFYPNAAALSPDGKWIYLTGYSAFFGRQDEGHGWLHYMPCVMRMPSDCSKAPEAFIGEPTPDLANGGLACPSGLAVDRDGRIYVSDMTEGLLVFSPDGKKLHTVKTDTGGAVHVSPQTGEIFVTGWSLEGAYGGPRTGTTPQNKNNVMLYRLTACTDRDPPKLVKSYVVAPDVRANKVWPCSVAFDFSGKAPRMWFANALGGWSLFGSGANWKDMNARIFDVGDDKLVEVLSFETQARRDVAQSRPPRYARQRPYVNPADGCVYIAEQIQPTVVSDVQCFDQLVRVDPATGRCSIIDLPFDTEDMAFDRDGLAYFRTESILARYDPKTWREVPFDYGQELEPVTHYGLKPTKVLSAPYFKGGRGASGKIFGMGVNARGDIAMSFYSTDVSSVEMAGDGSPDIKRPQIDIQAKGVKPWTPQLYPGRSTYAFLHIWDKHGKLKFEDAVPGLGEMSDFKIDEQCNIYMIANMVLPGYLKAHPDKFIDTLVKMPAGRGKIITDGKTPVPLGDARPNRQPDAIGLSGYRGNVWLQGAQWMLGGLGANARDLSARACHCEANCGIAMDYFGRSFVPAIHRYEVVIADSAGNVMLRFGRYGNVEDGVPLVGEPGQLRPRPIGGDEIALVSPKWLAVDSDKRLFISDRGNYRIVCVRLGYQAEERLLVSTNRNRS